MMRKVLGFTCVALAIVACGSTAGSSSDASDGGAAAPACPATAPTGGACPQDGLACTYDCTNGGPSTVHCIKGTWAAERSNRTCLDSGVDAGPPPADAPFACGQTTCGVNQYCVMPCCGGAAPLCETSLLDAGACPPGFHTAQCQQGPGCEANPCTPPAPFCVDAPSDPKASGCGQYDKGRTLTCLCA
jgi:hypothetical protein